MSEVERQTVRPTLVDEEVIGALTRFDKVLKVFVQLDAAQDGEAESFYPDEIVRYVDFSLTDPAWERRDYSLIRFEYVRAWINFYQDLFSDLAYFTPEEFCDGTASIS